MTNLNEYKKTNKDWESSAENQRIIGQLWHREAYCNINCLITELAEIVHEIPYRKESDINSETLMEMMRCPATALEAIENTGDYDITEHNGEYYWYETCDHKPYGDLPPKGHLLFHRGSRWYWCDETSKDDKEGWYSYRTKAAALEDCWDMQGIEAFDTDEEAAQACCEENRIDIQESDREVYEHYAVSDFLGRKLKDHGEQVIDFCNLTVWCRTCTGQAVSMDCVMYEIAAGMGILKGQENDWSKGD